MMKENFFTGNLLTLFVLTTLTGIINVGKSVAQDVFILVLQLKKMAYRYIIYLIKKIKSDKALTEVFPDVKYQKNSTVLEGALTK